MDAEGRSNLSMSRLSVSKQKLMRGAETGESSGVDDVSEESRVNDSTFFVSAIFLVQRSGNKAFRPSNRPTAQSALRGLIMVITSPIWKAWTRLAARGRGS